MRVGADLLLAHTTDMGPWLWEHPEFRRTAVWLHNWLQSQPIEAGLLGIVAACGTGSAVVNALRPQSSPLMDDPAFMPPDLDGDLFGDVPSTLSGFGPLTGHKNGGALLSLRTSGAAVSHSSVNGGIATAQQSRPRMVIEVTSAAPRPKTVLSELTEALSGLVKSALSSAALMATGAAMPGPSAPSAAGSAGRAGRGVLAGVAAAVDTSPAYRRDRGRHGPHPFGGGLSATDPSGSLCGNETSCGGGANASAEADAVSWLQAVTELSVDGFADRARAHADSTARGVALGLAATAAVGTALWAGAGLMHHVGEAATPRLRSRCLEALEQASCAAASCTAELGRLAFGREEAAAVRLRAWGSDGAGGDGTMGLGGGETPGTATGTPARVSDPWLAASGAFGHSILSDVVTRLTEASLASASYGRFIRAMRRHSGVWIPPQTDRGDAVAASAFLASAGHAQCEPGSKDDGDGGIDAATVAAAVFVLGVARGRVNVREALDDARAQAAAAQASSPQLTADAAAPAAAGGTGSTGSMTPETWAVGRATTPLEALRVESPTDTALRVLLEAMYALEVVEPSSAVMRDDESYAPDCAFCLDPMLPHQRLVRSTHGVCSRHHVFHAACFPLSWAQDKGCPMCREAVFALRPAAVDTPFVLHATGSFA